MRAEDPETGIAIRFVTEWDIKADIDPPRRYDVYRLNSEEDGMDEREQEAAMRKAASDIGATRDCESDPRGTYGIISDVARAERLQDMLNRANNGEGSEPMTLENVDRMFEYMAWASLQQEAGDQVEEALVAACKAILRNVRPSRLRTRALNSIYDARMLANAAITHRGRF